MNIGNRQVLFAVLLLLVMSLACNFGVDLPFSLGVQTGEISPEDVSVAATRASAAAATAAAVAGDAGQMAATAVSQGDGAVATAIASEVEGLATILPPVAAGASTGSSLEQKLSNIQPDANGNFAVTITETDLSEYIANQAGAFQSDALSAQDIAFEITPDYLQMNGDVTEPIAVPLVVKLRPVVVGSRLQFELLSASAGIFPLPDSMLDMIETVANSELSQALSGLPANMTLQDTTLANGQFTIIGNQN